MSDKFVKIVHKNGEEYAVLESDFARNPGGQYDGFKAVSHEDGTPLTKKATAETEAVKK